MDFLFQVISLEVWNKAMSHWMQAINQEVPKDELVELQTVFCKIAPCKLSNLKRHSFTNLITEGVDWNFAHSGTNCRCGQRL